jgi:uncharacterized membrane protein (DUF485 family)
MQKIHREEPMGSDMRSLSAARTSIKTLVAVKLKFLVPMTIIFVVGYIGLTILAGFGKKWAGIKVLGSVNLGFALIALNYVLSWVLAIVYERVANNTFDPLAEKTVQELTGAPQ